MKKTICALASGVLLASLGACVVNPPPPRQVVAPAPRPNPYDVARERFGQINGRIDNLGRRIDWHVNAGYYPPPHGGALHHRLDVIRQEARDMAAQHGGGLSEEEQRVLNHELDGAARAIGE
ncbi:hypothetical protein GWC77_19665 [Paraburkholderia sp. NMBU_R16]|uniref:hypothetical protein n=1 Tax=Paraburkholderia sp. NMBU_R16 TaxID=2698676 RepID=UPI001565542F|nr:hypothetical protein [Paraburkholderia sp. NMBU_R16]NRO98148.1 hypothetical protein [Paraburkholderia sp. NMBU_R16]